MITVAARFLGNTLVHIACEEEGCDEKVFRILFAYGAQSDLMNNSNQTPQLPFTTAIARDRGAYGPPNSTARDTCSLIRHGLAALFMSPSLIFTATLAVANIAVHGFDDFASGSSLDNWNLLNDMRARDHLDNWNLLNDMRTRDQKQKDR